MGGKVDRVGDQQWVDFIDPNCIPGEIIADRGEKGIIRTIDSNVTCQERGAQKCGRDLS